MSNAGAVRAGRAFVELYGDKSKLVKDLNAASATIKKWGASIQAVGLKTFAIGAAILTPLINGARIFTTLGGAIDDVAQRTGAGTEFLSRAGFAAERTGATLADVETGMRMLAKSGKFAGMSTEAAFETALAQIAAVSDPTERAQLAIELFGKSGTTLIPLAKEYENLIALADRLGVTMSRDAVEAADALGDAWTELVAVWNSVNNAIGEALAEDMQALVMWFRDTLSATAKWIRENQNLVRIALYTGAAIAAVGGVLAGLGVGMVALSSVMTAAISLWGAFVAIVAASFSPLGLLILSIRGAITAFMLFTDAGRQLQASVILYVQEMAARFISAVGAMANAVRGGDLQLAFDIALSAIKVAVLEHAAWLVDAYKGPIKSIAMLFESLGDAIVGTFRRVSQAINEQIINMRTTVGFMSNMVGRFAGKYLGARGIAPGLMGSDSAVEEWRNKAILENSKKPPKIPSAVDMAVDGLASTLTATLEAAKRDLESLKNKANSIPVTDPTNFRKAIEDLGGGGGEMRRSVSGTFSAFAARGLGGGPLNDIKTATQQTAKNTDPRNQKRGVPVT